MTTISRTNLVCALIAMALWTGCATSGYSAASPLPPVVQEAGVPAEGLDMEQMMEAMKLAGPGPEHELLASRAGEWTTTVTLSGMTPDTPPQEQTGKASAKMILGGRFLQIHSSGSFMGMPFESLETLGFDRRHGHYTVVGMDTLGTYSVTARGEKDDDGIIRMHGEDDDPMGKQIYTFELEILSPDEHEYRVIFHQIGEHVFEGGFQMVKVRSVRVG